MDDSTLKEALRRLLAHGEASQDAKLMKMANAKKSPPEAPLECPECKIPLADGKCPKCGYGPNDDEAGDGELAGLLEQGAKTE